MIFIITFYFTRSTTKAVIITLAIGIGKEVVDSFTHAAQFHDLVSDVVGILIGGIFIGSKMDKDSN